MFTGIVEGTGTVTAVTAESGGGRRLTIDVPFLEDIEAGQSLSISGVCLTVEDHRDTAVEVFVAEETAARTYLPSLAVGDPVNVERPLAADAALDGHFVQGHVDGTGRIERLEPVGEDWRLSVALPGDLRRYVVEKGSIALDGISLTVATVAEDGAVEIAIIPETYRRTVLAEKRSGDPVHVEVDILAKYVERLLPRTAEE